MATNLKARFNYSLIFQAMYVLTYTVYKILFIYIVPLGRIKRTDFYRIHTGNSTVRVTRCK